MRDKRRFLNWSSGKDSLLALHELRVSQGFGVDQLVTVLAGHSQRVSMHGVPRELVTRQLQAVNLPFRFIEIPVAADLTTYNRIMEEEFRSLKSEGFEQAVFGDIFLEDLRRFREDQLERVGLEAVFPLWKRDTKALLSSFIDLGYKAITVAVNARILGAEFCGRILDHEFLKDLPEGIDPCGENGEFHTFVYDGPIFSEPVQVHKGNVFKRDLAGDDNTSWDTSFWYCEVY